MRSEKMEYPIGVRMGIDQSIEKLHCENRCLENRDRREVIRTERGIAGHCKVILAGSRKRE